MCGRGGIGRHARFRFWWLIAVGVQVPPPAPYMIDAEGLSKNAFYRNKSREFAS
jgi:hypothetical protein